MTQSNPRIGQTSYAASGMGAIGGPRGVAAGGLRILIEFITSYDPAAVKQLEADLSKLDYQEAVSSSYKLKAETKLAAVQEKLHRANMLRNNEASAAVRKTAKIFEAVSLQGGRPREIAQARKDLEARLALDVKSGKLTKSQAAEIANIVGLTRRQSTLLGQISHHNDRINNSIKQQRAGIQAQLGQYAKLGGRLTGRLAGLAIGAVGGILGGAVLGVGFELAQAGLEKVGEAIEDLIDPAKKAREAAKELADTIRGIASSENISMLEATKKYFKDLGFSVDDNTAKNLAYAASYGEVANNVDKLVEAYKASQYSEATREEAIKKYAAAMIQADRDAGNLRTTVTAAGQAQQMMGRGTAAVTDQLWYNQQAALAVDAAVTNMSMADILAADAKRRLADATAVATGTLNAYAAAIAAGVAAQSNIIQGQISAVGEAGPSARTQRIQASLERAQSSSGGGGGSNAAAIREKAEERQLILLKMRLRLMGTAINLEKYSGKFLLAAIDAKINALNKQAAAEDRVNRLQELRYKMSQPILRQEGESIRDYLERRAQENKAFIKEEQDIRREAQIEKLNELKEKTELEVALRENAEKRITSAASAGNSARIKLLQKQLEASQAADKKEAEARKKSLQKKEEDMKKSADAVTEVLSDEWRSETNIFLRSSKTLTNLWVVEGKLRALKVAKGALETYAIAWGLPSFVTAGYLRTINAYISRLEAYENSFNRTAPSGQTHYQHGGAFLLSNASTAFGGNIRTGEAGQELGVVLSNRVVKALKEQQPVVFGDINISRSDNPYRDSYQLRKEIKQAVREALR